MCCGADWISYHRYAGSDSRTNVTDFEAFFSNYDDFFDVVAHVERQRKALSPTTKTTIDEIGVILPNDNDDDAEPFPLVYWNACAASFAYLFGNLAGQGIDALGSSQLVGYPKLDGLFGGLEPQYPSVSRQLWSVQVRALSTCLSTHPLLLLRCRLPSSGQHGELDHRARHGARVAAAAAH